MYTLSLPPAGAGTRRATPEPPCRPRARPGEPEPDQKMV